MRASARTWNPLRIYDLSFTHARRFEDVDGPKPRAVGRGPRLGLQEVGQKDPARGPAVLPVTAWKGPDVRGLRRRPKGIDPAPNDSVDRLRWSTPGPAREWRGTAYFSLVSISEATCLTPGMP
jgi:hypothetical protein